MKQEREEVTTTKDKPGFASIEDVPYDYVLNSWFYNRMIKENRNVIAVTIGKTGSGKSWFDMAYKEAWYKFYFKEQYPTEYICFSIDDFISLLLSKKLRRGDFLTIEEGGVNMASAEWQNKLQKSLNYVLQSYRSMNIGLGINLPIFESLNKTIRRLTHIMLETKGIDKKTNTCSVNPLLLDWNQRSGELYMHHPKILIDGTFDKMQRLHYPKPSQELIEAYQKKKDAFVMKTIENVQTITKKEDNKNSVLKNEAVAFYLREVRGMSMPEIAEIMNTVSMAVGRYLIRAERKGLTEENIKNYKNLYEKYENTTYKPNIAVPLFNIANSNQKNEINSSVTQ